MQTMTSHHYQTSGSYQSPVDDQLYDLLQALVSKCEAIEAYAKYEQDCDGETRQLFQTMGEHEAKQAEQLLEVVRKRLSGSTTS